MIGEEGLRMSLSQEFNLDEIVEIHSEEQKIVFDMDESCCDRYPIVLPGKNLTLYHDNERINSPELITENIVLHYELPEEEARKEIDLEITENELKAYIEISFQPAKHYELIFEETRDGILIEGREHQKEDEENIQITEKEIKKILGDGGVFYGINEEKIDEIVSRGKQGKFLVAEGKYPEEGMDAHIEERLPSRNHNKDDVLKSDKIDHYRNIIGSILPGEVVAEKIKLVEGKPGKTVTGKEIPPPQVKDIKLTPGENIQLSEDGLKAISLIAGRPEIIEKNSEVIVKVLHQYIISGDLDKNEGSVEFKGDLIVKGNIQDYFGAKTEGNIFVKKNVNNGDLQAGQNVFIGGNVVGTEIHAGTTGQFDQKQLKTEKLFNEMHQFYQQRFQDLFARRNSGNFKIKKELNKLRQVMIENKEFKDSVMELNVLMKNIEKSNNGNVYPCNKAQIEWLKNFILGIESFERKEVNQKLQRIIKSLKLWQNIERNYNDAGSNIISQVQNSEISATQDIVVMGKGSYNSDLQAEQSIILKRQNSFFKGGTAIAGGWFIAGRAGVPMSKTFVRVGEGIAVKNVKGPLTVKSWRDKKTIKERKALFMEVDQEGKLEEKTWRGWMNFVENLLNEDLVEKWKQL